MRRPTASTITDAQLDALFEGLDLLEQLHRPHGPCVTLCIIETTRQRSEQQEDDCPTESSP